MHFNPFYIIFGQTQDRYDIIKRIRASFMRRLLDYVLDSFLVFYGNTEAVSRHASVGLYDYATLFISTGLNRLELALQEGSFGSKLLRAFNRFINTPLRFIMSALATLVVSPVTLIIGSTLRIRDNISDGQRMAAIKRELNQERVDHLIDLRTIIERAISNGDSNKLQFLLNHLSWRQHLVVFDYNVNLYNIAIQSGNIDVMELVERIMIERDGPQVHMTLEAMQEKFYNRYYAAVCAGHLNVLLYFEKNMDFDEKNRKIIQHHDGTFLVYCIAAARGHLNIMSHLEALMTPKQLQNMLNPFNSYHPYGWAVRGQQQTSTESQINAMKHLEALMTEEQTKAMIKTALNDPASDRRKPEILAYLTNHSSNREPASAPRTSCPQRENRLPTMRNTFFEPEAEPEPGQGNFSDSENELSSGYSSN